ncbi:MAG: CRISPR-associated protein Cas4 [Chitinispirillaceae bacterium]|nr:CRISPR-associated protein Cas4 [Chitinispirillaceae bacterium]
MFPESSLLPLSALQHLAFCERQCALIHIEQAWEENRLTAEGRLLHDRVHEQDSESRGDLYIVRGLKLRSLELGLTGVADVVEFHRSETGVTLPGKKGVWRPFPVEYKRGKPKKDSCDEVQLCGQAMCLEEMLNCRIESGSLYYGSQHKRHDVEFGKELRSQTRELSVRLHSLIDSGKTPAAVYEKKCERCSLMDICMPEAGMSVGKYLKERLTPDAAHLPLSTSGEGIEG